MIITQALVDKFFNNNCSEAEVEAIVTYLSENEDALDKFVAKAEWDAIPNYDNLNQDFSQQLLQKLRQELFKKKAVKVISFPSKYISRFVAAASIILVIAGNFWLAKKDTNNLKLTDINNTRNTILSANEKPANNWQVKANISTKPIVVKLEDGSVVTLYANTVIKYQQPFTGATRAIFLNGDAFFEVAKKKLKPFIVTSGSLSTTALGTSFRVTAYKEGKSTINVKLYTGKVIIKSTKSIANWQKDILLSPGEEMTYSPQMVNALVTKLQKNVDNNITPVNNANNLQNDIEFNNASLPDVISKLSILYSVTINYTKSDIEHINFTGSINKFDDIQSILNVIARMNGLQVVKLQEGFKIAKLPNP